jgi:hypothetical protein
MARSVDEELTEATLSWIVADHVFFLSFLRVTRIVLGWLLIVVE